MKSFFLSIMFVAAPALADPNARVTELAYAGSGCPAGTAKVEALPMKNWFTASFEAMTAVSGNNSRLSESRKICQVLVGFEVPRGYQFAIDGIWVLGAKVDLGSGDDGLIKVATTVQGESEQESSERAYSGPKKWSGQIDLHPDEVWSPCGQSRALTVSVQIRAKSANLKGSRLASVSLKDMTKFRIKWRRCD